MKQPNFHIDFTLNGKTFKTTDALLAYSKTVSISAFTFLSSWFDDTDVVQVQTSGSTGTPKSIQLQKIHMRSSALATGTYFNLFEGTKALLCLPTDYIAGKMMIVRALVLGWRLDLVSTSANPLKGIKQTYDFCAMVPLQLYNSVDQLHQIKKIIVGGGVISRDLEQKISTVPTEVFATYGMTETCTHIAIKKLNNFKRGVSNESEHRARSYHVLPNIRISTEDRGCLLIDAPHISDDLIVTNDLVKIISDNEFQWLGRYDHIINSGGIKLIPEQIERKLATIIHKRFFVAGIADNILGEKLVLVVESEDDNGLILYKMKHLDSLQKYELPKVIFFVEKFIETDTDKINRKQTLAMISFV